MIRRRSERGSISLELVILAPILLSILTIIAAFGRHATVQSYLDQAARDAARTATANRDGDSAKEAAEAVVEAALASAPPSCRDSVDPTFDSSSGSFQSSSPYFVDPVGDEPGQVLITVSVTCDVNVSDLSFLGFGQTITMTSTFSSPMPASYGVY